MPDREKKRRFREDPGPPKRDDAHPGERDPLDDLDEDADRHEQNIDTEEPDKE